ncbi:MAG: PAS domain S-box protein [Chitinophagaceae bacterium]|jgi:PAS domain S-box-containing protein|nr:PAS domain S-box protein [Chitinophagaceae bacterium]
MKKPNPTETYFDTEHFFNISNDLLIIAGFDGYFKKINPTVSKVLGYTEEELYAKPIHSLMHEEDRGITLQYRQMLKQGAPLLNFENRYIAKDGSIVWLSWTSMPMEKEQLVYAIAKNITHKKKVEEDRNSLIRSLSSVNENLKQLTYTTSHDLRSPVNNLLSIFQLLDTSKIEDQETLGFIHILKNATEELKKTLNNYVDILTNNNDLNVPIETVFLYETLEQTVNSISTLIKESNTTIEANFTEFNLLQFNTNYLQSIFLNLITNSIKYAKPHCSALIKINSTLQNGKHQIIYTDNGLGFDLEKVKDKLFGFQQQFHHHLDSKGIGLFLVYNHITRLGGTVHIDSVLNEGTTFIFTFKD